MRCDVRAIVHNENVWVDAVLRMTGIESSERTRNIFVLSYAGGGRMLSEQMRPKWRHRHGFRPSSPICQIGAADRSHRSAFATSLYF